MSRSLFRKIFPDSTTRRKAVLIFGIVANLALLGYFKYTDFFLSNFNALFSLNAPLLHLALPLAISFFTFQQIAYLCDSYHGKTAHYSLLDYSLFISFFPQLIAGPIVHHSEMMPQFLAKGNRLLNAQNIAEGIFIFTIGLFKKVIIADSFAAFANAGFASANSEPLTFLIAWVTSLSYTFQLYFDFSGYCDMALGIALFFNIRLPLNFASPYKAKNIQDFWRRWHMTLSRFLRDYIYIPLGGSRCTDARMYFNLFVTFLIGGLWHGAGFTFIIWGALHGGALVAHRIYERICAKLGVTMPSLLALALTFLFINFTWVFFRATSIKQAVSIIGSMLGLHGGLALPYQLENSLSFLSKYGVTFEALMGSNRIFLNAGVMILLALFITLCMKNSWEMMGGFSRALGGTNCKEMASGNLKVILVAGLFCASIFIYSIYNMSGASVFLYFNF